MPGNVERPVSSRPPWLLPVLLAVIIAIIILGVIFAPKIKNALTAPTLTPVVRTVVSTPTPGTVGPTPTSNPAILPSATPSNNQGVVTALPGATPVATVVGIQQGLISRPQHDVTSTQAAVDKGDKRYAFYLDPRQVVQNNLPHYGFTQGFQIVAPAPAPTPTPAKSQDGRPVVKFVVNYQSHLYTVFAGQAGKQGLRGIWLILSIVPGRQ